MLIEEVYQVLYCPCTEESAYQTISLHRTMDGAQNALDKHKSIRLEAFNKQKQWELENNFLTSNEFGKWEDWFIKTIEILE